MKLIEAVKSAGVVGAGGAGFPTHVKLDTRARYFIINAAECEPLIETDKYLCRVFPDRLINGAMKISEHLGAAKTVIAIKGKYKAEIMALQEAIGRAGAEVNIFTMPAFYPAGDEQVIVQQVCGMSVPERGIPIDVGAVVDNVGTVLNIADALEGMNVTKKHLSVVGEVERNLMLHVSIGTPITECIRAAKATLDEYAVIAGGPMMGEMLTGDRISKAVVTKTSGNLLILPIDHYLVKRLELPMSSIRRRAKSACIQCRMCTDLCPRFNIGHQVRPHIVMRNLWREHLIEDSGEFERAFGSAVNCCGCGICEMFACPMGLSPQKVNDYMKGEIQRRGIVVEKNKSPVPRRDIDLSRVPTHRLLTRLGLAEYYGKPLEEGCAEIEPEVVQIPLKQHIGSPAVPVKNIGDTVRGGELIARTIEKGLSANIHASMSGLISDITDHYIEIQKGGRKLHG
ncbi:MAG: 4Fe-4S dicluster domain-containing protein [Lachnospiraceae bacterium]